MTESEWLASTDPQTMLAWLQSHPTASSDRKLRLFSETGCEKCHRLYADMDPQEQAECIAASACGTHVRKAALLRDIFGLCSPTRSVFFRPSEEYGRTLDGVAYGNYRRWLRWRDGLVPAMAQHIYDDRAFDEMPILADALEEAGCDNADILNHCRQPGEHVRGCWVLDLLLGKE